MSSSSKGINILFSSASREMVEGMASVLDTDKFNFHVATSEGDAISLYEKISPRIILFYHGSVEESEKLYFQILRSSTIVDNESHQAVVLCDHGMVNDAYERCKMNVFFDYVVINPGHDRIRINLVIDRILASLKQEKNHLGKRELAKAGRVVARYRNELGNVLDKSGIVTDGTTQSFTELTRKMQDDVKQLTDRIKQRSQGESSRESMMKVVDEELEQYKNETVATDLDSTQKQIDNIVSRWSKELGKVQDKYTPAVDKLDELSVASKKLILVVEDNEMYGDIVANIIDSTGEYEAKLERSLHQGLAGMVCDRPDLVFLDYELPDGNADDFLYKVSQLKELKDIPVIMLTSHSTKDIVNTVLTQGAVDFVVKPANKELIVNKIKKWA